MADRYRVLDGAWNLANSWSTASGGTGGASVPTSSDDVYFDSLTPTGTHTVNDQAYVKNLIFTGFTGTFAGNQELHIYGTSVTIGAGMTHTFDRSYNIYGVCGLTTNGVAISDIQVKSTGSLTLQDKLFLKKNSTSRGVIVDAGGSFIHNDFDVEFVFWSQLVGGSVTFKNLIKSFSPGTMVFNGDILIEGDFFIRGGAFEIYQNFTVEGDFTFKSNPNDPSSRSPFYTHHNVITPCTVTCNGAIDFAALDIWRIAAAGTADWDISGSVDGENADGGGNAGITFLPPKDCFWVHTNPGGSVPWGNTLGWRTESGGETKITSSYPLLHDTAIFDENSFSVADCTVQMGWTPRICKTVWGGVANSPRWDITADQRVFGDITLDENMILASTNGNKTLIFLRESSLDFKNIAYSGSLSMACPGKTLTFLSDITATGNIGGSRGTVDFNNFAVKSAGSAFNGGGVDSILKFGSSVWTLTGGGFLQGITFIKDTGTVLFDGGTQASPINIQTVKLALHKLVYGENSYVYIRGGGMVWDEVVFEPGVVLTTYNTNHVTVKKLTSTATKANPASIDGQGYITSEPGEQKVYNLRIMNSTNSPAGIFTAVNSEDLGNNTNWIFIEEYGWPHKIYGISAGKMYGIPADKIAKIYGI